MRNLVLALLLLVGISSGSTLTAQNLKIGHVNSQDILFSMPETKKMQDEITARGKQLESQLKAMYEDYYTKLAELQEKGADMLPSIREVKIEELADTEARITKFESNAQNELVEMEEKLSEPILSKAQKSIEEVATSKGYAYVLDSSTGVVLHSPQSDDITPLVKAKLGIN